MTGSEKLKQSEKEEIIKFMQEIIKKDEERRRDYFKKSK
tara:strand:+ start:344 stop:460 length:117 start_codon:yes stop_codon:yes gene_type:complete